MTLVGSREEGLHDYLNLTLRRTRSPIKSRGSLRLCVGFDSWWLHQGVSYVLFSLNMVYPWGHDRGMS